MTVFYIVTVVWIFSVCLHEFGHAVVAYRGGDYTVAEKGYLTFNPLKYVNPLWSLIMPVVFLMLGGIGLPGGAVYINRHLLRSRGWDTCVSLAGPAMNVLLIFFIMVAFWTGLVKPNGGNVLAISLAFLMQLQISAVLLNLLPMPPLDGFQAIAPWLPQNLREKGMESSSVSFFLLFLLLWNVPAANNLFWDSVRGISEALGVDWRLGQIGFREYRFWSR
jgi:Zn-dependent protease